MGKLLLTGATGFIGGKLAEHYLGRGTPLRLLVRDRARLAPDLQKSCEIIKGDLAHYESLVGLCEDVDAVIHSAGLLGKWGLPYQKLQQINVQGTEQLLAVAAAAGVKRFIHLSAAGVTGPLETNPADETYSPKPHTDYERTKWEGEQAALRLARERQLNLLVIRPTFTYGPGDPHKLELFKAVKKRRFAFLGDGLSTIHPVYIDDLMAGIDLALSSEIRDECIIVGGERPVSKRDLIWGIADALGVKRATLTIPVWAGEGLAFVCESAARILPFNPPLTRSRVLMLSGNWGYSIQKAQRLLGYQPQVSLTEGLRRTAEWYRAHGWL